MLTRPVEEEWIDAGMTRRLMARLNEEEPLSATASKKACPAPEVNGRALIL